MADSQAPSERETKRRHAGILLISGVVAFLGLSIGIFSASNEGENEVGEAVQNTFFQECLDFITPEGTFENEGLTCSACELIAGTCLHFSGCLNPCERWELSFAAGTFLPDPDFCEPINVSRLDFEGPCPPGFYKAVPETTCSVIDPADVLRFQAGCFLCSSTGHSFDDCERICEANDDCAGFVANPINGGECFAVRESILDLCDVPSVDSTFCEKIEPEYQCFGSLVDFEEAEQRCSNLGGSIVRATNEFEIARAVQACLGTRNLNQETGCWVDNPDEFDVCHFVNRDSGENIIVADCSFSKQFCCEFPTNSPTQSEEDGTRAPTQKPTIPITFVASDAGEVCADVSPGASLLAIVNEDIQRVAEIECERTGNPCGCLFDAIVVEGLPLDTFGIPLPFTDFAEGEPVTTGTRVVILDPTADFKWTTLGDVNNPTCENGAQATSLCELVTDSPTSSPTGRPTVAQPTQSPSQAPSRGPTTSPTKNPTRGPTTFPTGNPTTSPTTSPTANPSTSPTINPTANPTTSPTINPTANPTTSPTENPTKLPTTSPTDNPTANPTTSPTGNPTANPTVSPTDNPTDNPTANPTVTPTDNPTTSPTVNPTFNPTTSPTDNPTTSPTVNPTSNPTTSPTGNPTLNPTQNPTANPTLNPTANPTVSPTQNPTANPTSNPTQNPTANPTLNPTANPTLSPTENPTSNPTTSPTANPTLSPTKNPTSNPTSNPTLSPTSNPTINPTISPTNNPTASPTSNPTRSPTKAPTRKPTVSPTENPTSNPTNSPTRNPTVSPTENPTANPTFNPTSNPTANPTQNPTANPTSNPTGNPTLSPSANPTGSPSANPTQNPTANPTSNPTGNPTLSPSANPTGSPTANPTQNPTSNPTLSPSANPTGSPTANPTLSPTSNPTLSPSANPTASPSKFPTVSPTTSPTSFPTLNPTASPTTFPTLNPTTSPTSFPTLNPTISPTTSPTKNPTANPTSFPTLNPTTSPTSFPTFNPTTSPTSFPTLNPTLNPTSSPTFGPTRSPTTAAPTLSPTQFPTISPNVAGVCRFKNGEALWSVTNDGDEIIDFHCSYPQNGKASYAYDVNVYPYCNTGSPHCPLQSFEVKPGKTKLVVAPASAIDFFVLDRRCEGESAKQSNFKCPKTSGIALFPEERCKCIDHLVDSDTFNFALGHIQQPFKDKWRVFHGALPFIRKASQFQYNKKSTCASGKCLDLVGKIKRNDFSYTAHLEKKKILKGLSNFIDYHCTVNFKSAGSRRCGKNLFNNLDEAIEKGCLEFFDNLHINFDNTIQVKFARSNDDLLSVFTFFNRPSTQQYLDFSTTGDVFDDDDTAFFTFFSEGQFLFRNHQIEPIGNFFDDVNVVCCCVELFDHYVFKAVYHNQGSTGSGTNVPFEKSDPADVVNRPAFNRFNTNFGTDSSSVSSDDIDDFLRDQTYALGLGGSLVLRFESGFYFALVVFENSILDCIRKSDTEVLCDFSQADLNEDVQVEVSVDGINFESIVTSANQQLDWKLFDILEDVFDDSESESTIDENGRDSTDSDDIEDGVAPDNLGVAIPEGDKAVEGREDYFVDNDRYKSYCQGSANANNEIFQVNAIRFAIIPMPTQLSCYKYVRFTDISNGVKSADDGFDLHALKTTHVCCSEADADDFWAEQQILADEEYFQRFAVAQLVQEDIFGNPITAGAFLVAALAVMVFIVTLIIMRNDKGSVLHTHEREEQVEVPAQPKPTGRAFMRFSKAGVTKSERAEIAEKHLAY